ncbi:hypothetical protein DLM75_19975 [Leptospira stimsonii]|uniref:Uncharacterized protein n=1 Tax=Leptospira stimsonii TaxID=2202203 RepID=A0A396YRD7_9LEPT|nr:hypothetical protein DLM75_19975 [Leptospira stimsonii]
MDPIFVEGDPFKDIKGNFLEFLLYSRILYQETKRLSLLKKNFSSFRNQNEGVPTDSFSSTVYQPLTIFCNFV